MSSDAQAAFGAPSRPKPASSLGYWLAAMLAFAGVAIAIAWFVSGITGIGSAVDDLARVPIPGTQTMALEEGKNAIYYESDAGEDARVPRLKITLAPVGGGRPVVIGPHGGDVTYSTGGHAGRSIAGFTLEEAGSYAITVTSRTENVAPEAVLAVGKGVGGRIVRAIVGAIAFFFGGLLLCGLTIILTARRRASARGGA
jgi:hypothetical protein